MEKASRTTIALVAAAILGFQLVCFFFEGTPSFQTETRTPSSDIVTSVDPQDHSGLKVNDIIDKARMDLRSRLVYGLSTNRIDETMTLRVQRGQSKLALIEAYAQPVRAQPLMGLLPEVIPAIVWKVGFLLVGLLVLLRSRGQAATYLALMCLAFAVSGNVQWLALMTPAFRFWFGSVVLTASFNFALITFYLLSESLVKHLVPRWLTTAARFTTAAWLCVLVADDVIVGVSTYTGIQYPVWFDAVAINGVFIVGFLYFLVGYVRSRGLERHRLAWIFWSSVLGLSGPVISNFAYQFKWDLRVPLLNTTPIIMALGYAYAIMRHRVIDVNFIINRTLVFTALSAVVIGVFSLTESIIERTAFGLRESRAIELLVPLFLGMSIHPLRKKIENMVESTFYKRKHETEAALRRMLRAAIAIQSPEVFIDTAAAELRRVMRSTQTAIYEQRDHELARVCTSGDGCLPQQLAGDDVAVVAAQSMAKAIDLHGAGSALGPVGYAFPMILRGKLLGLLVCEQEENDIPFDPDERELVQDVAHEITAELYAMRATA